MCSEARNSQQKAQDKGSSNKMADGPDPPAHAAFPSSSSIQEVSFTGTVPGTGMDYEQLAQAVAYLLKPMFQEAVDSSLQQGLQQIRKKMAANSKCMGDIEQRVFTCEDDMKEEQAHISKLETTIQHLI